MENEKTMAQNSCLILGLISEPDGLILILQRALPASVITSKAANGYQFKTGQRRMPGT